VSDLSLAIDPIHLARIDGHVDREGKLVRALDALGPVDGRDVVVVDAGLGLWAQALTRAGARVSALERTADSVTRLRTRLEAGPAHAGSIPAMIGEPRSLGLPTRSADVIVGAFSAYRGIDPVELAEADRVLRPTGRLLVIHDYGRDDLARMSPADRPEYGAWSRRDGPFLQGGFRVRVIHCWWTFESLEQASDVLGTAFGEPGRALVTRLTRPRISHNLAIYHRSSPAA
jgi:SAM-dependent methyltransferase